MNQSRARKEAGSTTRFLTGAALLLDPPMFKEPSAYPIAYLISFTCYGTWLHGEEKGSVDASHNEFGTPFLAPDLGLRLEERSSMDQDPYMLDEPRRLIVLNAIVGVCTHRKWELYAVHVRSNHLHAVVPAMVAPEKIMNDFKSYASRSLNEHRLDPPHRKRWSRHGSTRYLWKLTHLDAAIEYVLRRQGEPMAVYPNPAS
jgi:REP element-mobilizing transposase RayT